MPRGGVSPYLEQVKSEPLTPPKVESATAAGISQAKGPSAFSPKVYANEAGRGYTGPGGRGRGLPRGGVAAHHGDGVRLEELVGRHGGDVGHVGQDVDGGDQRDGDEDGAGQVPYKAKGAWLRRFMQMRMQMKGAGLTARAPPAPR